MQSLRELFLFLFCIDEVSHDEPFPALLERAVGPKNHVRVPLRGCHFLTEIAAAGVHVGDRETAFASPE